MTMGDIATDPRRGVSTACYPKARCFADLWEIGVVPPLPFFSFKKATQPMSASAPGSEGGIGFGCWLAGASFPLVAAGFFSYKLENTRST